MEELFTTLETYRTGIFVLVLLCFVFLLLLDWVMRILSLGKYKRSLRVSIRSEARQSGFLFLMGELLSKIITDFRHFLAILLLIIFGIALFLAIDFAKNVEDLSKALQSVMATLGTLIGSIIGYYYGESAARKSGSGGLDGKSINQEVVQGEDTKKPIESAPPPPVDEV